MRRNAKSLWIHVFPFFLILYLIWPNVPVVFLKITCWLTLYRIQYKHYTEKNSMFDFFKFYTFLSFRKQLYQRIVKKTQLVIKVIWGLIIGMRLYNHMSWAGWCTRNIFVIDHTVCVWILCILTCRSVKVILQERIWLIH